MSVEFGGHLTGREVESARGDDEGPLGSVQRVGNGLYGPAIRGGGAQEISPEGEVVFEGQVITPSDALETSCISSRSSKLPRCTSTPAATIAARKPRNEPALRPGERNR